MRLALRREALTELASDELSDVVGAADQTPTVRTLPVNVCLGSQVCFSRGDTCVNC